MVVMSKGESFGVSTKIKNARQCILYFISPFYTEKHIYVCYFLRITASGPVGHAFVWLPHLQLKYHLNFIDNLKHVKKYILLHFFTSFPKYYENLCNLRRWSSCLRGSPLG